VWNLETAKLMRSIDNAHSLEVVVLKFKDNTLISGSADISLKVCPPPHISLIFLLTSLPKP
jgi:hypothetical protein